MAFAPYVTVLLVNLVQEKENKLKELMRIMGTSDVAYWLSWVITYAVIMLFAVLIMNAITVPGGIFGRSNYIVMVIICYLYGLTIIMMSFMFTPFFKNAKSAGLFASLITTIFGAIAIPLIIVDVPNPVKWALSLFSPTAFGLAISQVACSIVSTKYFVNRVTIAYRVETRARFFEPPYNLNQKSFSSPRSNTVILPLITRTT